MVKVNPFATPHLATLPLATLKVLQGVVLLTTLLLPSFKLRTLQTKTTKMVKRLLKDFGMSQRELAKYLDSDNSVLSRFAAGRTYLQPGTIPQFYALLNTSLDLNVKEATIATPNEMEREAAMEDVIWYRANCMPLQKKLALVKVRFQQGHNMLKLLDAIGSAPEGAPPRKQRWLDEQRYAADNKIKANGWAVQTKLQISIDLLYYQASLWEASLKVEQSLP